MVIHSLSVCFVGNTSSTTTHIGVTVTASPIPAIDVHCPYYSPLSLHGVGLIVFEHVLLLLITFSGGRHIWAQLGMVSPDSNYLLLARWQTDGLRTNRLCFLPLARVHVMVVYIPLENRPVSMAADSSGH